MIKKILKYTLGAIFLLGVLSALVGGGGVRNQPRLTLPRPLNK